MASNQGEPLPEPEDLLALQLGGIVGNLIRSLIGYIPSAFAKWPQGVARLRELMREKNVEEPNLDLLFDVVEENPELCVAAVENAFWTLPLSVRLSIKGALGIAQGILSVKKDWAKQLMEGREKLIVGALKGQGDPEYVELAQSLERHPKTLKALTKWLFSKLGIEYVEGGAETSQSTESTS